MNKPDPSAETYIFGLCNLARKKYGIPLLTWREDIRDVARAHALDMIQRHYFAHQSPEGYNHSHRLHKAGFHYWISGENIACGNQTVQILQDELMDSPGHKANILLPNFCRMTVGVYQGLIQVNNQPPIEGLMIVQLFTD